jgi:pyridoxine 5-phosphate synthase
MPIRLHVNIDHVATLRNARGTAYPDPVLAAQICELAGADGITAHLREDRRHIRDNDVRRLQDSINTLLNLEMAATDEMLAILLEVKPAVVTLVPERREEQTTEGGLDVHGHGDKLKRVIAQAREAGIKTSLFIAAEIADVEASKALGAEQIELHTGDYCHEPNKTQLQRLAVAAQHAHGLGLEVAAGHGLTQHNVIAVAAIPEIEELNIGHALIGDSVFVGLDRAVTNFRQAIQRGLAQRP